MEEGSGHHLPIWHTSPLSHLRSSFIPPTFLSQALLNRKAMAYLALLLGRAAAFAFYMLRANVVRKQRTRGARIHCHLFRLRRALRGWHMRVALRGEMEARLMGVFRQVRGGRVREEGGRGGRGEEARN
jgi:hypothetical protein